MLPLYGCRTILDICLESGIPFFLRLRNRQSNRSLESFALPLQKEHRPNYHSLSSKFKNLQALNNPQHPKTMVAGRAIIPIQSLECSAAAAEQNKAEMIVNRAFIPFPFLTQLFFSRLLFSYDCIYYINLFLKAYIVYHIVYKVFLLPEFYLFDVV